MNAVIGRLGTRRTVLIGGLCLSLSAILGSLATDVTSLIVSQAVFHGKQGRIDWINTGKQNKWSSHINVCKVKVT